MNKRNLRSFGSSMLATLAVLVSPLVFAATAEAMGQGLLFLLLYSFVGLLPVPYSFLLASYALLFQNHPDRKMHTLIVASKVTMVFVAVVFATILFLNGDDASNVWSIVRYANMIAAPLIAVMLFTLIKLEKIAVIFALIPLSLILSVLCLAFILLIVA